MLVLDSAPWGVVNCYIVVGGAGKEGGLEAGVNKNRLLGDIRLVRSGVGIFSCLSLMLLVVLCAG